MGRALTIETFELIIALPNEPTARLQVDTKDERINEVDEMIEIEEVVIGAGSGKVLKTANTALHCTSLQKCYTALQFLQCYEF